jgi:hypothetical protein
MRPWLSWIERLARRQTLLHEVNLFKLLRIK